MRACGSLDCTPPERQQGRRRLFIANDAGSRQHSSRTAQVADDKLTLSVDAAMSRSRDEGPELCAARPCRQDGSRPQEGSQVSGREAHQFRSTMSGCTSRPGCKRSGLTCVNGTLTVAVVRATMFVLWKRASYPRFLSATRLSTRQRLLCGPGPTDVEPSVLAALRQPMISPPGSDLS
jgi:hypothetical protein